MAKHIKRPIDEHKETKRVTTQFVFVYLTRHGHSMAQLHHRLDHPNKECFEHCRCDKALHKHCLKYHDQLSLLGMTSAIQFGKDKVKNRLHFVITSNMRRAMQTAFLILYQSSVFQDRQTKLFDASMMNSNKTEENEEESEMVLKGNDCDGKILVCDFLQEIPTHLIGEKKQSRPTFYDQKDGLLKQGIVPKVLLPFQIKTKQEDSDEEEEEKKEENNKQLDPCYDHLERFNPIDRAFNHRYFQQQSKAGIELFFDNILPDLIKDNDMLDKKKIRALIVCHGNLIQAFLDGYSKEPSSKHIPENLETFRVNVPIQWTTYTKGQDVTRQTSKIVWDQIHIKKME